MNERLSEEDRQLYNDYKHNLQVAGEDNPLRPIGQFRTTPGLLFETPTNNVWRIRVSKKSIIEVELVGSRYRQNDFWTKRKLVRIPENYGDWVGTKEISE